MVEKKEFETEATMKYAVQISYPNFPFVMYAGIHGKKSRLEKVEGWVKRESAEKFIQEHKRIFGNDKIMYEIVTK